MWDMCMTFFTAAFSMALGVGAAIGVVAIILGIYFTIEAKIANWKSARYWKETREKKKEVQSDGVD